MTKHRSWLLVLASAAVLFQTGCDPGRRPIGGFEAVVPATLSYPGHQDLELRFQPTAFPLTGGCPTVFLHLQDASGRVVRTFDHRPPRWMPGEGLRYRVKLFQSALGPALEAGDYQLVAGLYDPSTGRRSRLRSSHPETGSGRYRLGTIGVGETVADGLEIVYSSDWQEPEPGSDAQILVRSWFAGRATLAVTAEAEPAVLWLQVAVPPPAGGDLVLDAGEDQPRVIASVSCADDPPPWDAGRHQLEVELAAGERCEIGFRANFVQRSDSGPQSAALETISVTIEPP